MTQIPAPTAHGDLATTPFLHVILSVEKRRWTGTLAVWSKAASGQDRIVFVDGRIRKTRVLAPRATLESSVLPLFPRPAGAYAFYEGVDLAGDGDGLQIGDADPWMLAAASLRGPSRDDVIGKVLQGLDGLMLTLKPDASRSRLQLSPKELGVLDVLQAEPTHLDRLERECGPDRQLTRRVIYLHVLLGMIDAQAPARSSYGSFRPQATDPGLSRNSMPGLATSAMSPSLPPREKTNPGLRMSAMPKPPASKANSQERTTPGMPAPPNAPKVPPADLTKEQSDLWNELVQRHQNMRKQNFFQMLEVSETTVGEAETKYYALIKKFHPDRLTGPLAAVRSLAEELVSLLSEAHQTLSSKDRLPKYIEQVRGGGGTPEADEEMTRVLTAAANQQKAEALIKARNYRDAEALLQHALELNPTEPSLSLSFAWLYAESPDTARLDQGLAFAEKARAELPNSDKTFFYMGVLQRRKELFPEAQKSFERALLINKNNHEADRELRLLKAREKSKVPAPAPSLFGKLFGKK